MDPVSAIVGALVAGATAVASDLATEAVKSTYNVLKALLITNYKLASTSLLETMPQEAAFQSAVRTEIESKPAILDDPTVLEKAMAVQQAISRLSEETLTRLGIDIKTLESGGSIIAERVQGGIRGDHWKAAGDVRLTDVDGPNSSGK